MDIIEQLKLVKEKNNISGLYEIYDYFFRPPVSVIPIKIMKGKKIVRVRLNNTKWKHFNNTKDLSCPPPHKCGMLRANIDGFPIFYGVLPAHKNGIETIKIAMGEASILTRDVNRTGIERLTYSIWEVTEEMTLILAPFGDNYDKLNPILKELEMTWQEEINPVNFEEDKLKLCEFISAEFSKENSDYFFSSHYSHFACNILSREHDGIAYPTVKFEGDGLNVAIKPESIEKKLQFVSAVECYLIKPKIESDYYFASVYDSNRGKNGKIKYIKRADFRLTSKYWSALMSGLKFIN